MNRDGREGEANFPWGILSANVADGSHGACFALPVILELVLLNVSINNKNKNKKPQPNQTKKPPHIDRSLLIRKKENRKLLYKSDYWKK